MRRGRSGWRLGLGAVLGCQVRPQQRGAEGRQREAAAVVAAVKVLPPPTPRLASPPLPTTAPEQLAGVCAAKTAAMMRLALEMDSRI